MSLTKQESSLTLVKLELITIGISMKSPSISLRRSTKKVIFTFVPPDSNKDTLIWTSIKMVLSLQNFVMIL